MSTRALQPEMESASPQAKSYTWVQVFLRTITRPSATTFEEILKDPQVSSKRACKWIFYCTMVALYPYLYSYLRPISGLLTVYIPLNPIILYLILVPLSGFLSILGLIITASIWNWLANSLGGEGIYLHLIYTVASIQSPMIIILSLVGLIPFANLLFFPMMIYQCVLIVIAMKAVYKFGWVKAILLFFLPYLVIIGASILFFLFIFTLRTG
jgi:hypothetical protein